MRLMLALLVLVSIGLGAQIVLFAMNGGAIYLAMNIASLAASWYFTLSVLGMTIEQAEWRGESL